MGSRSDEGIVMMECQKVRKYIITIYEGVRSGIAWKFSCLVLEKIRC